MSSNKVERLGLVGLGVMGRSLAQNFQDQGVPLVVYERDQHLAEQARPLLTENTVWTDGLDDLAASLPTPRAILLMVQAGEPVDQVIDALRPHLQAGDIIIDGGNSAYLDTKRRQLALATDGIELIGLGVSGGEEGARYGPAMMSGGPEKAWELVAPLLTKVAAKTPAGEACCKRMGEGASGHLVKTVHNGIEYGIMQALAEAYDLMRSGAGKEMAEISDIFEAWNKGPLQSYLVEISSLICRREAEDGSPMLDKVVDKAGQKGTGRWASLAAIEHGVAASAIAEAVFARAVSSEIESRQTTSRSYPPVSSIELDMKALEQAILTSSIIAFSQGFALIEAVANEEGWKVELGEVAKVWRGGCILRARLLDDFSQAIEETSGTSSPLIASPHLSGLLRQSLPGLRMSVASGVMGGIALPVLSSSLAWVDGMTRARGPANFLQGLRDCFGAHGFERIDQTGSHSIDWSSPR